MEQCRVAPAIQLTGQILTKPSMTTAVSLIICTRDRARQLDACLASVAKIRCDLPWEAVIVDNGSCDETRAVARRFFDNNDIRGLYAWEPEPGLSRARNAGLNVSSGEIAAFTDDDCYPAPDLLDRICEIFADPRVGFIGGRILLHDPDDYPLTVNESMETLRFSAGSIVPCAAVQGANMAFRRAALVGIGGFDPALGAGTPFPAEDWDAAARVCSDGWDGGYFPAPAVSHHHGRTATAAASHLRTYHYASGAVYAKLLMDRTTRWPYGRHWARRILGDAKYHQRKLVHQFRGAIDYWRSSRISRPSGPVSVRIVDRALDQRQDG
jgi:glycosyltransferase involved in cell wall biosynthesis